MLTALPWLPDTDIEFEATYGSGEGSGEHPLADEQTLQEPETSGDIPEIDLKKENFLWWTNVFQLDKQAYIPEKEHF